MSSGTDVDFDGRVPQELSRNILTKTHGGLPPGPSFADATKAKMQERFLVAFDHESDHWSVLMRGNPEFESWFDSQEYAIYAKDKLQAAYEAGFSDGVDAEREIGSLLRPSPSASAEHGPGG